MSRCRGSISRCIVISGIETDASIDSIASQRESVRTVARAMHHLCNAPLGLSAWCGGLSRIGAHCRLGHQLVTRSWAHSLPQHR